MNFSFQKAWVELTMHIIRDIYPGFRYVFNIWMKQ